MASFLFNIVVQYIHRLPVEKRILAVASGLDGAYHRFVGDVALEKYIDVKSVESKTEKAIWELMYFGKTITL